MELFECETDALVHFAWLMERMEGCGLNWWAWTAWAYAHPSGFVLESDGVFLAWESVRPKLEMWLMEQGYDVPAALERLERWVAPEREPYDASIGFDPFADD